jgi:thymidylate synthase
LGYINTDTRKELGPVYGHQWRRFNGANLNKDSFDYNEGTDQIARLIHEIKTNPDSRRLILSAWNPEQLSEMALPPCHTLAQFRVIDNKLSCQLYQRSADMFLGVPFNIASYSLLTHMIAQMCELKVGDFVWSGGDCHIYLNHFEQVNEQISRTPMALPYLLMPAFNTLNELLATKTSDYKLINYNPMDSIPAPMAV